MLTVVVPCFNEGESVRRFPAELFPALDSLGIPYEVLAVDDGSTDGTAQALDEISGRFPLRVLRHPENRGLGAALRTSFAQAKGDWIATLDADLTFHPSQLGTLIEKQKETGADMVCGSPFLSTGGATDIPWTRRLPSMMINAFYRGLFDPRLTAYTPVFRLYRAESLKSLKLGGLGFEINAEIAARFVQRGLSVAEVPAVLTSRKEGVSKLSRLRELLRHGRLILRLLGGG